MYPDTCIEGLEGSIVKGLVSSGLDHVMSLVANLLGEVVSGNDDQLTTNKDRFPSWIRDEDTKLLQANGVTADAVVAADGSGDYTKVMDAVSAAPESSMKRYVIYVKKGVYVENVEIKKKKWNIMLIGEGMDATIISGSRNYVDGSTTFRSATFGKNDYIHTPYSIDVNFSFAFLFPFLSFQNFLKKIIRELMHQVALGYDRIFCSMFKEAKNKSLV